MKKFNEANLKDKRGNVLVSAGLKVRHKKSQFEYTVDSVVKDNNGKIVVLLKKPEEPRFDSKNTPQQPKQKAIDDTPVHYEAEEIDDFSTAYYTPEDEASEDLIAIPSEEFEKEYEVK